jgi:hypothetical protein
MDVSPKSGMSRARADRGLYTWAALIAVLVVFAGFARSYYLKGVFGAPALSPLLHIHGLVMSAWFLLFVVQVWLVEARQVAVHRRLGYAGAVLAVLVVAVGTLAGITAAGLGRSPPGVPPLAFLAIPLGDMCVFAILMALGMAYRQRGDAHKRWMLLASLSMLTAAYARIPLEFIGRGGLPLFFALTDATVIVCVLIDTWKHRRLHPVFGWGLALLVGSQVFRFWFSGTETWMRFAGWLTS